MSITISGSSGIVGANGSASAPALTGGDFDSGIFFPNPNTVAFSAGGTEVFRANTGGLFSSTTGLIAGGASNAIIDYFNGTGSQTAFTLSGNPATKNNTSVYVSGVYQAKSTYSLSTTTLTFSTAPPSGTSNIEVVWALPISIGTPSDGTITDAKINSTSKLYNRVNDIISVKDYGATGDGSTDDSVAIQNAVNAGSYVYFPPGTYRITTTINIPANVTIEGREAKIHYTGSSIALRLRGDRITVRNLTIYGDWAGPPYVGGNIGIYSQENVFEPSLAITTLYYATIENCTIYNFGQSGIQIFSSAYVNIRNNTIYNTGQHGMLLVSVFDCAVTGNMIKNIGSNTGNLAYGIALSRLSSATIGGVPSTSISLVNGPIPENITISNNYIEDVFDEVAIDLHSGKNIAITGNVVRTSRIGVNLEHGTAGVYYATCTNISIAGNSFSGLTTAGKVSAGVFIDAQSGAAEIATGIAISGNTFNYFGLDAADIFRAGSNGVIYVNYASGVSITGNTFNNSYGRCVALGDFTYDCTIIGNTVSNLSSANNGTTMIQNAFETLSGSARAIINGNTMVGSSGYLIVANSINTGYGLKVGGENIVVGGALIADYVTQSRIRGGGYLTSPRVLVAWNASGTIINTIFEDINYLNSTPTITKNGTGDFTVSWPSGIFGNSLIFPVYNAADPASGEVRNTQISSTSITSTRCKSFDTAGSAIDCTENWLLVWGR